MPNFAAGYIEVIHAHSGNWPFYGFAFLRRCTRAINVGRRPWGFLLLSMGLVAAPARYAHFAPLFMWYVRGLMGVSLLLGGIPWEP